MNSTIERKKTRTADSAPLSEWTDEELLLEYRSREDRLAFEQLVNRYEGELYNYLRHYLGDAEMAEDAFQATFLQVHLKCDRFEPGRKVRPWLYTVATNQAIDAQRRNRRHRMVSLDHRSSGRGRDDGPGPLVDLLEGQESSPFARADAAERERSVREAVDLLPEALREVLLLVYYQGMKYREAAEVLAIPVGTVKSRLHAAIGKLNDALTLHADVPGHG
jgi:RNA polymerase sigma-70 factor (ECF subfamily)